MKRNRRLSLYRIAFALFFCEPIESSGAGSQYVDEMVSQAVEQELYQDPYWHLLLHYRPGRLRGIRSLVDDPLFFSAPDGKTSPQSELEATLRASFEPYDQAEERDHAICRFPARFRWLDQMLSFDRDQLPSDTCAAFEQVYETFLKVP